MSVSYTNRSYVASKDPRLAEALDAIMNAVNNVASQTNASVTSTTPAPPSISALSVTAANGYFDIQIQDNNPVSRGISYFVEYSFTPGFVQPFVVPLGPARNAHVNYGNVTLYFRAYSQYPTSTPSTAVYFGTQASPTAVSGGGAVSPPAAQPSTGSGTASGNGTQGGQGFGSNPARNSKLANL